MNQCVTEILATKKCPTRTHVLSIFSQSINESSATSFVISLRAKQRSFDRPFDISRYGTDH